MKSTESAIFLVVITILTACSSSTSLREKTNFTHLDSLTDTYLVLQDSVLQSWNRVIKTESEKSKTLEQLLAHLSTTQIDSDLINSLDEQVQQLEKIRFTPKTLWNSHVVNEYDESCSLLIQRITDLSSKEAEISSSKDYQTAINWINQIQNLSTSHRLYYDSLAQRFNQFVEKHREALKEMERNGQLDNKPLFKVDTAQK